MPAANGARGPSITIASSSSEFLEEQASALVDRRDYADISEPVERLGQERRGRGNDDAA